MSTEIRASSGHHVFFWPGHLVAPLLIGIALCFFGLATLDRFTHLMHPLPGLRAIIFLALLSSVLIGMWLPNRFALYIGRRTGYDFLLMAEEGQSADWMADTKLKVTAAACMVLSGLAMMACRLMAVRLGEFYQRALISFHWTSETVLLLEFVLILAYVGIPVILLGAAINCSQRVALFHTHRLVTAMASLFFGVAAGMMLWGVTSGLPPTFTTALTSLLLLLAGLANMGHSRLEVLIRQDDVVLPAMTDRWRFVFMWLLAMFGFLLLRYMFVWPALNVFPNPVSGVIACTICVALGLGVSTRGQWFCTVENVAMVCMVVAVLVALIVIFSTTGTGDELAWLWVSLPCFPMGMVLGGTIVSVVRQGNSPARGVLSACVSIGLGAGLASLTVILEFPPVLASFHVLVFIILVWLAMGGLLLIYEPGFSLRRRWPRTSFMVGALLVFMVVLPQQATFWSPRLRLLSQCSVGRIHTVSHLYETGAKQLAVSTPGGRAMTFARMLRQLQLTKERHAAVVVTVPDQFMGFVSDKLQVALAQATYEALQPDGVFITRFRSGLTWMASDYEEIGIHRVGQQPKASKRPSRGEGEVYTRQDDEILWGSRLSSKYAGISSGGTQIPNESENSSHIFLPGFDCWRDQIEQTFGQVDLLPITEIQNDSATYDYCVIAFRKS